MSGSGQAPSSSADMSIPIPRQEDSGREGVRGPQQRVAEEGVAEEALELQETPLGGAKLMGSGSGGRPAPGRGPRAQEGAGGPTQHCPVLSAAPTQAAGGAAGRGRGEAPREAQLGRNRWQLRTIGEYC